MTPAKEKHMNQLL